MAREAGVAASTVSRALSNPGRVSPGTRHHVYDVAQRLGYRSSRDARDLGGSRTQLLALLVPDITNPHIFGLVRGAEAQARAAGFTLVVANTGESPEFERAHLERLDASVDGFLLASSRLADPDLSRLAEGRWMALFNREAAGLPSVTIDSADGGRQVIDHLVAMGHRRIAYLAGPVNAWADAQRWAALSHSARQSGAEVVRCGPFSPTLDSGSAAADVGMASGATALVAFNDLMAIGVLRRLERLHVEVPGQVSVVGHDDIFGADFCHPALTTLASPAEQAGRSLVDLLLGVRRSATAARVVLPGELRVRDSTGSPPG
ncbi:MAG TPA: LacI family DNA-binding transcriptional regulator [Dermatophilaceae bacterium]|nr:LacI family DNA-binding transcriptional regulator [Dermatophilaceae bacterium]